MAIFLQLTYESSKTNTKFESVTLVIKVTPVSVSKLLYESYTSQHIYVIRPVL